jgi:hypothetical protein
MTGQIPIVQLNVESMRHTMQQAFSQHLLDMDKMFQHAIEQACRPENVQAVLQDAAERFLREAVDQDVRGFFAHGPGREEVRQMVARALTRHQGPTAEQLRYLVKCFADDQEVAEALDRFDAYERGEADPEHRPDMGPELDPCATPTDHGAAYLATKQETR